MRVIGTEDGRRRAEDGGRSAGNFEKRKADMLKCRNRMSAFLISVFQLSAFQNGRDPDSRTVGRSDGGRLKAELLVNA